jgi:hypothetical protein
VDLACCAVFALEWGFWLWLSQRRLRYLVSLQSLVDILAIVPTAASSLTPNTYVSGTGSAAARPAGCQPEAVVLAQPPQHEDAVMRHYSIQTPPSKLGC